MKLAGCVIKDSGGKVLLLHRNSPRRTQWEIPGGGVEDGETPEQAAVRELKEELDVTVVATRQIGSRAFEEDGMSHEYYWIEGKIADGKLRLTGSDGGIHDGFHYFSTTDMRQMFDELSANTKNFVAAVECKEIEF